MADLINLILPPSPRIEPVGHVDHHSHHRADILVGMNHAGRDDQSLRLLFAGHYNLPGRKGGRFLSTIPEDNPEAGRTEKGKEISLLIVFMWAPGNARTGH